MKAKVFGVVDTLAEFNALRVSSGPGDTEYTVGGGLSTYGAPEVEWNKVVFILAEHMIWTHGEFFSDYESGMAEISSLLSGHAEDADVHVTTGDKAVWGGKQDAIADLGDIRNNSLAAETSIQQVSLENGELTVRKNKEAARSYGVVQSVSETDGAVRNGVLPRMRDHKFLRIPELFRAGSGVLPAMHEHRR